MLKSIYSRIFFLCTFMLMFACALTGLIVVLYANHLHEAEAYQTVDSTARSILMHVKELYAAADGGFPEAEISAELESHTLNGNVDSYIFNSEGIRIACSDHGAAKISLSSAMRDSAADKPYFQMGGAAGNFSEPTAIYVERFEMEKEATPYYLMMYVPVAYVSNFSSELIVVLVVVVLVIGVLSAILFYLNTMQMLKPVLNITHAAEAYAKGDFSQRLKESGDSELDYLATTMNRMADFIDKNERSRKRFISDISHELKTPMTTIGGFVDNILDGTIPPEQEKHYLKIVSSEVQRMSRMVHSMLNISRFEEGTMTPKFERFDLTHLLIKTLLLFEKKIDAKGLSVQGLEECPKTVAEADKDLMQQVFYNLSENAIKFTDQGGTLTLAVDSDAEQAHVHIRNSGEGLTEDEISHVFERFYKTDESRGKDTTGVGLGLSIVCRIMILHGGTVTVTSVKGEYTEFTASLPLVQPKKAAGSAETEPAGDKGETLK